MRRVLVTGGGTGIGRAIAQAFAEAGDAVVVSGRRPEPLEETAAGLNIETRVVDVTNEASVAALFDSPFDVVVANAGMGEAAKIADTPLDLWQRTMAVNLTGPFLTFREALRGMGPGGRLIAVASIAGLKGWSNVGAYVASKHGVIGLVRATAHEVAKSGITCNAICPGFVETEMSEAAISGLMGRFDIPRDEAVAKVVAGNPMKRMIAPEEVASAALWLASPGAASVNGHTLSLSGGEI